MNKPGNNGLIDQISVIEDLDPEPEGVRERGLGPRRDLMLGIPLLVLVILFAVWQYWRQEYLAGQYRAGIEAVGHNEWEAAIRFFAEASGYSDADAQAKGAQAQIDERDRLYEAAQGFADKGEWLYALRDVRAAARIQPDYSDLKEQEETALRNAYRDALGGALVMRDNVDPPGLYYRTPDGWVWLEGSDYRSQPLARDEYGRIVYDIPSDVIQVRPPPMPGSLYNTGDLYIGRKLVWAQPSSGGLHFTELELDASHFVPFISGKDGLWLAHPVDFIPNDHHNEPIVRDPFHVTELAYQPYAGGPGSTVQIPPSTDISGGETIVSIDPNSNRYLVAEWAGADSVGVNASTTINLYVQAMGENTRRLVYTHTGGGLQSAQISPSGRFVVVHSYRKLDALDVEEQTTVLLDLQDPGRSADLITMTMPRSISGASLPVMTSAFVQRGSLKENLILSFHLPATTHIQLLDPLGDPRTVNHLRTDVRIEGSTYKNWEVIGQDQAGVLVIGQAAKLSSATPLTSTLNLIRLSASGEQETHNLSVSTFSGLLDARIVGDEIRWVTYEYVIAAEMRRPVRSLYGLGARDNDRPHMIFTTGGIAGEYLRPDPSFRQGEKLLAYTNGDELHVRTYDGEMDVMLESGVPTVIEDHHGDFYTDHLK